METVRLVRFSATLLMFQVRKQWVRQSCELRFDSSHPVCCTCEFLNFSAVCWGEICRRESIREGSIPSPYDLIMSPYHFTSLRKGKHVLVGSFSQLLWKLWKILEQHLEVRGWVYNEAVFHPTASGWFKAIDGNMYVKSFEKTVWRLYVLEINESVKNSHRDE